MRDAMLGLRSWVKDNPRGYAILVGWAQDDARLGRQIRTKEYEDRIRHVPSVRCGDPSYLWDNNWSAPLARMIAADYPELRPLIPMRASQWDDPPSARPYDAIPPAALEMGRLFI